MVTQSVHISPNLTKAHNTHVYSAHLNINYVLVQKLTHPFTPPKNTPTPPHHHNTHPPHPNTSIPTLYTNLINTLTDPTLCPPHTHTQNDYLENKHSFFTNSLLDYYLA